MTINSAAGEKLALIGTIDPGTVANTQIYTDVADMSKWHQVLGIAMLGNMASETIDFKAYSCNSDGSSSVELKACTQLAANASTNDNTQLIISVRAEDLSASGKQHVRFGLVTGGATGGPASVAVIGVDAKYQPANDNDLATVQQIKL